MSFIQKIFTKKCEEITRAKYVKAYMVAITKGQKYTFSEYMSSKSNALRAIKRFENINNIKFDPFDEYHVRTIAGCGPWEEFFRNIGKYK